MIARTRREGRGSAGLDALLEGSGIATLSAIDRRAEASTGILARKVRMRASGIELLPPDRRRVSGHDVMPDLSTFEGAAFAALLRAACADGRLTKGSYDDSDGVVHFASDVDFRTWRTKEITFVRIVAALTGHLDDRRWEPLTLGAGWDLNGRYASEIEASTPGGDASWSVAAALLDDLWALTSGRQPDMRIITLGRPDVSEVSGTRASPTNPGEAPSLATRVADLILAVHPIMLRGRDGGARNAAVTLPVALDGGSAVIRATREPGRAAALRRLLRFSIRNGGMPMTEAIGELYMEAQRAGDARRRAETPGEGE